MAHYPGRRPNVNDKYRGLNTASIRSMSQLEGLVTAGDMVAGEVNADHAKLEEGEADRQSKKHLMSLKEATALVLNSGDKRRRPRGVSKELFKKVRALKLTRTAKIRRKK